MVVCVQPVSHRNTASFRGSSVPSSMDVAGGFPEMEYNSYSGGTNAISNVAYGWINLSETTKGIVGGILGGALAGAVVSGINMAVVAASKLRHGLSEHPLKGRLMSTKGKILAYTAFGAVFAWKMIDAFLTRNQRTANVDHMLYTNHRSDF